VEVTDGHRRWMVNHFHVTLFPDKTWVIPRSDTVFQRQGDKLVFIEGDLNELDLCRRQFASVGIEVVYGTTKGQV
jgi:hypothetical protein